MDQSVHVSCPLIVEDNREAAKAASHTLTAFFVSAFPASMTMTHQWVHLFPSCALPRPQTALISVDLVSVIFWRRDRALSRSNHVQHTQHAQLMS